MKTNGPDTFADPRKGISNQVILSLIICMYMCNKNTSMANDSCSSSKNVKMRMRYYTMNKFKKSVQSMNT